MKVSECCGANFYPPGYPDNDVCLSCGEHAGPMEDEPSINVAQMPDMDSEAERLLKEIKITGSHHQIVEKIDKYFQRGSKK